MKVALVCPASLPATQFGGIMFLCLDIAREISNSNNNVTIFTTDLDFANNAHTFNAKLPRIEKIGNFTVNRSHVWFSLKLFFVNPDMYFQLKKDKPDIIHTIGVRSFQSLVAAVIAKKYKIPLVLSDQGGLTTHPDIHRSGFFAKFVYKIQKPIIRYIIKQAATIIVPNQYEKNIFLEFTDGKKIEIVPNGIYLEQFPVKPDSFTAKYKISGDFILFLGRFARVKGIDVLLRAWSQIVRQNEDLDVKLVIMGVDFGFESEMLKMIEDLKMSQYVVVIKKPPREDVLSAYSECLFLVLPSRWELSPLTPLEGFVYKKPTISTTAHGIPYTIKHGENSILVEAENHSKLSDAILDLIHDKKKRQEYGESGYQFVQHVCNSKIMSEKIEAIYKEIINTHAKHTVLDST